MRRPRRIRTKHSAAAAQSGSGPAGFVRIILDDQLGSHPEIYAGYVPMGYREYLKKMPKRRQHQEGHSRGEAADKKLLTLNLCYLFSESLCTFALIIVLDV